MLQISALLQSENKIYLVDDIEFDWLNPKKVLTNTYNVNPRLTEVKLAIVRAMTESERQRLSTALLALTSGDFSFQSTSERFARLFATLYCCHACTPAPRFSFTFIAILTRAAVGGVFVLQFKHVITFYSVLATMYYFFKGVVIAS